MGTDYSKIVLAVNYTYLSLCYYITHSYSFYIHDKQTGELWSTITAKLFPKRITLLEGKLITRNEWNLSVWHFDIDDPEISILFLRRKKVNITRLH
jgi:hypothetical protein